MRALQAMFVALATAVALTSVAAAGPAATKQRVQIDLKAFPEKTFALATLQSGALKRDSGTLGACTGGGTRLARCCETASRSFSTSVAPRSSQVSVGRSYCVSRSRGPRPEASTTSRPGPGRSRAGQVSTPVSPEAGASPKSGPQHVARALPRLPQLAVSLCRPRQRHSLEALDCTRVIERRNDVTPTPSMTSRDLAWWRPRSALPGSMYPGSTPLRDRASGSHPWVGPASCL